MIDKIREELQKKIDYYNEQYESFLNRGILSERAEARFKAYKEAIDIINQVEAEYNNDIVYQLAMKYALCLTQYGVDITEKLETTTQNAMALERAYIRGRQDECDKFSEWRDRHNNGWIACSERLPEGDDDLENVEWVLCYGKNRDGEFKYEVSNYVHEIHCWMCSRIADVIAWQPLPQPPKGE